MKHGKPLSNYVKSFLWLGLKKDIQLVIANSYWQIGDGSIINFWRDKWLTQPIVDLLQIHEPVHNSLHSVIADFLHGNSWSIPLSLASKFPRLYEDFRHVVVPINPCPDQLVWNGSESGILTHKDVVSFINQNHAQVPAAWGKTIWNPTIPPSKSFIAWRIIHGKMPTEENLKCRGCTCVSICGLCHKSEESSRHLFVVVTLPAGFGLGSAISLKCQ